MGVGPQRGGGAGGSKGWGGGMPGLICQVGCRVVSFGGWGHREVA